MNLCFILKINGRLNLKQHARPLWILKTPQHSGKVNKDKPDCNVKNLGDTCTRTEGYSGICHPEAEQGPASAAISLRGSGAAPAEKPLSRAAASPPQRATASYSSSPVSSDLDLNISITARAFKKLSREEEISR